MENFPIADRMRAIMALTCRHISRTTWKSGAWICNDCATEFSPDPESRWLS